MPFSDLAGARRPLVVAFLGTIAQIGCGDGKRIDLGAGPLVPAAAFGSSALVTELAGVGDDEKPTLTTDELELYFLSMRSGGPGNGDVWYSKRAAVTDAWGPPSLVAEVSSPSHERSPAVSADGAWLWFASDRSGGQGGLDIWVSSRPARSVPWSAPVPVVELNSPGDDIPRPPGLAGLIMPLAYRASPTDGYQLETASRASVVASWSTPVRMATVDTANIDVDGFLTDDGLLLYFSSDRTSGVDQDLFVATRTDVSQPFATFMPLAALNTPATDRDPWVSPNGREMYFASNRSGSVKIYRATR